jgi:hypothetical protein
VGWGSCLSLTGFAKCGGTVGLGIGNKV